MENENIEQKASEEAKEIPQSKRKFSIEILLDVAIGTVMALIALVTGLTGLVKGNDDDRFEFIYSASTDGNKSLFISKSFILGTVVLGIILILISYLLLILIRPSGIKPKLGKNLISLGILSLFGWMAFIVISVFFEGPQGLLPSTACITISAVLVAVYDILLYKLYCEDRTYSNHPFWEIFRFAIVGAVAGVIDFIAMFVVQFGFFQGSIEVYVTALATAIGFLIGVVINYLMSTHMVYKNTKTNFSKSHQGRLVFLILSGIGLALGIGIMCLFYNLFQISYPICFVIKEFIVMVYNYITRKKFVYR